MNRIAKIMLSLVILMQHLSLNIALAEETKDDTYISQLSAMLQKYDTDDYFATMSVTIGEPNLIIDGVEVPIDESGSVAYIENGRTMMPVRGIAEAIGAEVSYDNSTQTVTVETDTIKLSI